MLYGVIMAGGAGTRFWPESRRHFPKQFLRLAGQESMLEATVSRIQRVCPSENIIVVTNQALAPTVRNLLPSLPADAIVGEPAKRDTAPCIALAATWLLKRDPDAIMLVAPADHVINTTDQFAVAIQYGVQLIARSPQFLVTFGVKPTYPAVSFGYLERGERLDAVGERSAYRVARFREKPDLATASVFCESGRFYWNSGIFVWKASAILAALERFAPEIVERVEIIAKSIGTAQFEGVFAREFSAIKGQSIDYAVMEKYESVAVIEASFDWDDVGNWTAVPRVSGVDINGNAVRGKHLALNTTNSIVRSADEHLIVTLGIDNLIVVHTPDATLVAKRDDEAAVRKIVEQLERLGWTQYL